MLAIWAIDWSKHFEPSLASGDGIGIELLRSGYARQDRALPNDTSFRGSVSPQTLNEAVSLGTGIDTFMAYSTALRLSATIPG
jgi:hypothetical protein